MDSIRLTRRNALALLAGGAVGGLLAACQSVAQPQAAPAPAVGGLTPVAPTAPAASQPRRGGTLRAGIQTDLPNTDPWFTAPSNYDALWVAFDRLIALDAHLQPQPMLAESWDLSSDFTQVKLNLRNGVQFHSGREFTSDDVKYNLMHVRDPKVGSGSLVAFSNWWTIETPDKYTVELKSDSPRPLLWDYLEYLNIADSQVLDGPDSKTKVGGTGPFVFAEWSQGDHIHLVKNANYWQGGKPYLDSIDYAIFKDAQTMLAQLEAGGLDMALNPPLRDLSRLKNDSTFQAISNPQSGRYYTVGWTTLASPLDDKRVRQALNYALDRQRFVDTLLDGFGTAETLFWLPGSPAYDPARANYYTFDLDKAAGLLRDAGATRFQLEYLISPNFPELADFGQIYQADLAKIGVTLTIRQVDSAAFFDAINNRKYTGMYAITSARAQLQPASMLLTGGATNPSNNNSGYSSDAYTQLTNAAATETDPQKQKQIYSQLNDLLLDAAFNTALASASPHMLLLSSFQGIGYTLHEGFDWSGVWKTA
ncbi:MAG: ABC transporter substrate-binding protein [Chloroflexi bacterium]|nr:ABC transporter substrate-binding protein [Chloroflexota bacterium]